MSDAPVVGSAAFELRAKRDQMKKDLDDAKRDLGGFTKDAEREVGGSTSRIGGMLGKLGLAVGALSAVFAAGLAIAMQFGKASLEMADGLVNSARRIGISTDALQEWQYVARATGEDADAVAGALERFSTKFDQAAAGVSKSAFEPFKNLRYSQDDLRNFKSAEEALESVTDRILALKSESDRAAIAEKLGLGPLVTALREGGDQVDDLRDKAHALGFVLDKDVAQRGSEAQGKLEDLSQVISVQLADAFIGAAGGILEFTESLAQGIRWINNMIDRADMLKRAMGGFGVGDSLGMAATPAGFGKGAFRFLRGALNGPQLVDRRGLTELANGTGEYYEPPVRGPRDTGGGGDLVIPPGRTRVDRSAEREARRAERVQEEINRAKARALRIEQDDLLTIQQIYDLRQKELEISRAGEDADLKSRLARKDLTKAEFDQLASQNAINRGLEDRIAKDLLSRDLADERLANERALNDLTVDLLTIQSGAARTAGERRKIELQLLQIVQRRAREDLETELSRNPSLSEADKNDRRGRLADLQAGQTRATNDRNMSPLEQWRDASLKTAGEIDEAYERIAANGLDALNNGIVDAIMGTRTLGEVFSSVAKQILADLLQIGVRRGITEPLADALFGSEKGGGAKSWISDLFKFAGSMKIPGFANGVENFSGGLAYVHAGEVLTNLAPGTSVIPANVVNGMGGGGTKVFDLRGALVTQDLIAQVNGMVAAGEARAVRTASNIGKRSLPGMQQSHSRLGTT